MALTVECAAFLDELRSAGHVPTEQQPSAQAAREESERRRSRLMIDAPPMEVIRDFEFTAEGRSVSVRMYEPPAAVRSDATVVWFHGGGWTLGSVETAHAEVARIAAESGATVVSVEYALAPENPYPAGPNDCFQAVIWAGNHIEELGGNPEKLFIGGVSSGGNLAALVAQRILSEGGPSLAGQVLLVPCLDLTASSTSWSLFGEGYLLTRATYDWYLANYLQNRERLEDPAISPGLAETLQGLPPTLLVTAEYDPLRDEGRDYAERLAKANVPIRHVEYPGVIHGFLGQLGPIPESERAFALVGEFLRASDITFSE